MNYEYFASSTHTNMDLKILVSNLPSCIIYPPMVNIICFNTLKPRQDGRHFADDIFTYIFFKDNCFIMIKFSLKYVRKGPIDNNPALVQIMAWRRSGDKPLSEPMMVSLLTHICVIRPQWVKTWPDNASFSSCSIENWWYYRKNLLERSVSSHCLHQWYTTPLYNYQGNSA